MKKSLNSIVLLLTITSPFFWGSCEKDKPADPLIPNEEELITTLKFTLTPAGGGTPLVLSFRDLDGEGGNAPVITADDLAANTTYTASLILLNELGNPAKDISLEVKEEGVDHQFFFQTDLNGLTITYDDKDANNKPVGLETEVITQGAGSGVLKITLRHQPDKTAPGVSRGDISNAGGETDIEVNFNVEVN